MPQVNDRSSEFLSTQSAADGAVVEDDLSPAAERERAAKTEALAVLLHDRDTDPDLRNATLWLLAAHIRGQYAEPTAIAFEAARSETIDQVLQNIATRAATQAHEVSRLKGGVSSLIAALTTRRFDDVPRTLDRYGLRGGHITKLLHSLQGQREPALEELSAQLPEEVMGAITTYSLLKAGKLPMRMVARIIVEQWGERFATGASLDEVCHALFTPDDAFVESDATRQFEALVWLYGHHYSSGLGYSHIARALGPTQQLESLLVDVKAHSAETLLARLRPEGALLSRVEFNTWMLAGSARLLWQMGQPEQATDADGDEMS